MYSQENLVAKSHAKENGVFIEHIGGLELWQVGRKDIAKYSEFVYNVYVDNYSKRDGWVPEEGELQYMIDEDNKQFDHSVYFAFRTPDGRFVGGSKVTNITQSSLEFPIQTEFGYDLNQFFSNENVPVNNFWHLGRVAIDKHVLKDVNSDVKSNYIIKRLLLECSRTVSQIKDNTIVAEVDALAYRICRVTGLNMRKMGEGKNYLGSFTYPAYILYSDMKHFTGINGFE
ncbi:hypothetical protein BKI52_18645 [marine bacterium AO1-C]|nr:hypothetical protein BKI52_18645 [marine bacterium AO1-C]